VLYVLCQNVVAPIRPPLIICCYLQANIPYNAKSPTTICIQKKLYALTTDHFQTVNLIKRDGTSTTYQASFPSIRSTYDFVFLLLFDYSQYDVLFSIAVNQATVLSQIPNRGHSGKRRSKDFSTCVVIVCKMTINISYMGKG
jgi:hypothetical protein